MKTVHYTINGIYTDKETFDATRKALRCKVTYSYDINRECKPEQVEEICPGGCEALEIMSAKNRGLVWSHTALAKGYITRGGTYSEEYTGRFGEGVKIHLANVETRGRFARSSNRYHYVMYYVKG